MRSNKTRNRVRALMALLVLVLAAGCGGTEETAPVPPTAGPKLAGTPELTATLDSATVDPTLVCPPARGTGTISPAISIYSITFVVNGVEQVVRAEETLSALPGDEVQVVEVTICSGPAPGDGGEACVDFAPVDQNGQEMIEEHQGTHLVRVTGGLLSVSWPSETWIVSEEWSAISAVLNHWPPGATKDLGCASGRCERDDRIIAPLR